MKNFGKLLIATTLFGGLSLTSCDKKTNEPINNKVEEPAKKEFSQQAVANTKVQAKLKAQGITLDATGKVLLDDKAKTITSLDLSETELKDFSILALFPKLEEVKLAKNRYELSFDFAQLPKTITSVDLSDNKLYEFKGLSHIDKKSKATVVERELKSLVLPHSAKYNIEVLPFYFKQLGDKIAMSMQNKEGKAEAYTTLREVPDADLRGLMKELFPKKFVGDKIDLFKRFGESRNTDFNVSTFISYGEGKLQNKKPTSFEGIQYVVGDPEYRGAFSANLRNLEAGLTIPYIKIGSGINVVEMVSLHSPIVELSSANELIKFVLSNNKFVKELDLSHTKIGRVGVAGADLFSGSFLILETCPELENVQYPDWSKENEATMVSGRFISLPKVKSIKLKGIQWLADLTLLDLPDLTELSYPTMKFSINQAGGRHPWGAKPVAKKANPNATEEEQMEAFKSEPADLNFNISKEVYDMPQTVKFLKDAYTSVNIIREEQIGGEYYESVINHKGKDYIETYDYTALAEEK